MLTTDGFGYITAEHLFKILIFLKLACVCCQPFTSTGFLTSPKAQRTRVCGVSSMYIQYVLKKKKKVKFIFQICTFFE